MATKAREDEGDSSIMATKSAFDNEALIDILRKRNVIHLMYLIAESAKGVDEELSRNQYDGTDEQFYSYEYMNACTDASEYNFIRMSILIGMSFPKPGEMAQSTCSGWSR